MTHPFLLVFWLFCSAGLGITYQAVRQTRKGNVFGLTPFLTAWGIFVWGDGLVAGPFWVICGLLTIVRPEWQLAAFLLSVFWSIRGVGEVVYWLNQQFSLIPRNPPHTLWGHALVKNDSIWYMYQFVWQCVTTLSVVASVYFGAIWLRGI